jgi:hypothetical protein
MIAEAQQEAAEQADLAATAAQTSGGPTAAEIAAAEEQAVQVAQAADTTSYNSAGGQTNALQTIEQNQQTLDQIIDSAAASGQTLTPAENAQVQEIAVQDAQAGGDVAQSVINAAGVETPVQPPVPLAPEAPAAPAGNDSPDAGASPDGGSD